MVAAVAIAVPVAVPVTLSPANDDLVEDDAQHAGSSALEKLGSGTDGRLLDHSHVRHVQDSIHLRGETLRVGGGENWWRIVDHQVRSLVEHSRDLSHPLRTEKL